MQLWWFDSVPGEEGQYWGGREPGLTDFFPRQMYLFFCIEFDIMGVDLVTVLKLSSLWIDGELDPVKGKSF